MTDAPPFQHDYDLGDLGRNGAELRVAASGEDLARIAQWAEIRAVKAFGATVQLRKHAADRFALDAELVADIVQDCVVTLEPVESRIVLPIHRELHLARHIRLKPGESIALNPGAGDDEVPEEIDSLTYDLAAPLLEEFLLAVDPYPRAPGVEFAPPAQTGAEEVKESPFAVLKSLKNRT